MKFKEDIVISSKLTNTS